MGQRLGILAWWLAASACATAEQRVEVPAPLAMGTPAPLVEEDAEPLEDVETSTLAWVDEPLEQPWGEEILGRSWWESETSTPTFDLPMSDHPTVEAWVKAIQIRGKRLFRVWLARSSRYAGLFERALTKRNLPKDLVFLAMVESGFSPAAHSWASAAGPWQFMPVTARRYGLRVGFWVDERRDFEKSSEAAADHLSWLYGVFGDWHLAMAAYNAGAGRVKSGLRRSKATDFWSLQKTRHIRRETKQYVPKILASAIIAKNPRAYGFDDVPYLPPIRFSKIKVEDAVSLVDVAEGCGGLPPQVLYELNPSLRVRVTPPGETWQVRVPEGLGEACESGLRSIPRGLRMSFRFYERNPGEPLGHVADRMYTSVRAILKFHKVSSEAELHDFLELAVPVPMQSVALVDVKSPRTGVLRGPSYGPGKTRLVVHRVRTNDSLWKLSRRYGVSISKIKGWNGLRSPSLQIGQRLRLYLKGSSLVEERAPVKTRRRNPPTDFSVHRVENGESLWTIARQYGTTVEQLRRCNDLGRQVLREGMELSVPVAK